MVRGEGDEWHCSSAGAGAPGKARRRVGGGLEGRRKGTSGTEEVLWLTLPPLLPLRAASLHVVVTD